jgi:hypothetical protein
MRAYRLIACLNCGHDDGTICAAHPNTAEAGKGVAIKADDRYCAKLCYACRPMIEQRHWLTYDERVSLQMAAHLKTVIDLCCRPVAALACRCRPDDYVPVGVSMVPHEHWPRAHAAAPVLGFVRTRSRNQTAT